MDRCTDAREALFEVRYAITKLEKAVGRTEIGTGSENFQRNMLSEIDDAMEKMQAVRARIEREGQVYR